MQMLFNRFIPCSANVKVCFQYDDVFGILPVFIILVVMELAHMDEFIDDLLREERVCDIILPRIQVRNPYDYDMKRN